MDVPEYEGTEQILSPSVSRFESMSVVANSGKLLNSGLGSRIDSSEAVIRMNSAPVEGFEEDVGSKTTFRFINGLLQKGKTLNYTDTPRDWLETVENENLILMPIDDRSATSAKEMAQDGNNTVYEFQSDFHEYINKDVKGCLDRVPSTGVLATLFAIHVSKAVRLYGFGFHQEEVGQIHYWEDWDSAHSHSHNWEEEESMIQEIERSGRITIHREYS